MVRHNMNQPGKSLGVIRLGGLGHMAVKFGKAFGLKVTIFSTSESKRDEAINLLGADNFVISSDTQQMEVLTCTLHNFNIPRHLVLVLYLFQNMRRFIFVLSQNSLFLKKLIEKCTSIYNTKFISFIYREMCLYGAFIWCCRC